ncbi:MAG: cytochrome c [Chitinophagales bacterium]|tara:strand:- start:3508 stop:3999 length:492 start_codon:yes stop_codon:yes gene_type:complete
MKNIINSLFKLSIFLSLYACGETPSPGPNFENKQSIKKYTKEVRITLDDITNPLMHKGVGPITKLVLSEEIDEDMAAYGLEVFNANCIACHKMDSRLVGPALAGVVERRSPEWIMNMILNPEGMLEQDTLTMALFNEYKSPMLNQHLSEEDARAVLEYFRADF